MFKDIKLQFVSAEFRTLRTDGYDIYNGLNNLEADVIDPV